MSLSDISIRRPVFATVLNLVVVLLGFVAFQALTVREYPNIDEPAVTVTTTYDGASAQIMETEVTKILEDSLAGIEGIKVMTSGSREEISVINVRFNLDRDPDDAAAEVRDRVSRVRGELPDAVDEPVVAKVQADAEPIIWLVLRSDKHSQAELTDYADRYIQDALQTVNGVAEVMIFGERRYAMRLWLDAEKLAAHALTPADVERALRAQNLEVPGGRVESSAREFSVLTQTDLRTPDQFEDLVLAEGQGRIVRLRDVGRAELGVEDDRIAFRYGAKNAVGLGIVRQAVANPLEISQAVDGFLPKFRDRLPDGMVIDVGLDTSVFIEKSIDNVARTLVEAVLLVAAVIFVFLRSARATLVPLVTVPVSLIGSLALMAALGFSINTLTLLAMVLAIGLVVDDAIVVLENIARHVEEGEHPVAAALKGAREIAFPVIAMTITLAAVYVPVAFMGGRTGKLFTEFALTLAGAVLVSGFTALTLSPMMSSRLLKPHAEARENRLSRAVERALAGLEAGYRRALGGFLTVRAAVIPLLVFVAAGAWVVGGQLRSELAPIEDRGMLFAAFIGPEGSSVDYMAAYGRRIEGIYGESPEIDRFGVAAGVGPGRIPVASTGLSFIGLSDWDERERSSVEIATELGPKMMGLPGVFAFPITPASLGANLFAKPVEFVVKDSVPYEEFARNMGLFLAEVAKNPNLVGVETDLKLNTPQLKLNVDRDRVADLGIEVAEVGRAVETLLAGREVTRFKRNGEQYEVIVKIDDAQRTTPEQMDHIFLRGREGNLVPLSAVATVEETVAPQTLNHFDRSRAVTVTANLAPGYALGEALAWMEEAARRTLPATAQLDLNGQSREFAESSASLYVTFGLAVLFIYLVLAAQFESFVAPFTILLTVPLSLLGALLALHLTGNTLNVYSQIGLITLVGLITKHGILIVEFANQRREAGLGAAEAAVQAAVQRLRPILMTTGAMVLGAVPLAVADGAGAESRQQLGWVIVGGMTLGTLLTLFVVPAVYSFLAPRRRPAAEPQALAVPAE
ncbi:MAG TPA: efflux RND transporter permease subunit [Azospirillaceae bacterium]|nr:efflux RND transporter permease subunit [Azospirillaceae bacterium]